MSLINTSVLMSDANNFSIDQAINPYYHHESLDSNLAVVEHDHIRELLRRADIDVITVDSPADSQDGVYTANWALVRGNKAVLARLPDARKAEEDYAEAVLSGIGKKVIRVPEDWKFSGQGDALACGNYLFCGSGYRSDVQAQAFAAETLGYERVQLQTIPQIDATGLPVINSVSGWADSMFYDIDLALAVIKAPENNKKGLIAYCPEAFTPESRQLLTSLQDIDTIIVTKDEAEQAFATNLISNGTTVVMSGRAPLLAEEIRKHGLAVLSPDPDITELAKGGGFIRCTTLTLE